MQEKLRKEIKLLKALYGITYRELADCLEIQKNSFYNWLKGYYNLSATKEKNLIELIDLIKNTTR